MHALLLSLVLYCQSPNGFEMFADIKADSQTEYEIKLRNTWSEMPVHQKSISFNEKGEMVHISTSAWWESFSVSKTNEGWIGEYWYDNSHYELSCKEIP
jgi:hypothetical protein